MEISHLMCVAEKSGSKKQVNTSRALLRDQVESLLLDLHSNTWLTSGGWSDVVLSGLEAASAVEYVRDCSQAQRWQKTSATDLVLWTGRRTHFGHRGAPGCVCQEVYRVQCHHFASAGLGWWSGRNGRLRICCALPDLDRWLCSGGTGELWRLVIK